MERARITFNVSEDSQELPSSLKEKFNKAEEFDVLSSSYQKQEEPDCQISLQNRSVNFFNHIYQPLGGERCAGQASFASPPSKHCIQKSLERWAELFL